MANLDSLIENEPTVLLSTLEPYQKEIVDTFLQQTGNNFTESIDKWLNASTKDTVKFGGVGPKTRIYFDKLLDELEKFLCGDKEYEEDREKIKASNDKSEKYIIGVLSAAIGSHLGVVGTFLVPVVVLYLISLSKMPHRAWCAMRKEEKEKKEKEEREKEEKEKEEREKE